MSVGIDLAGPAGRLEGLLDPAERSLNLMKRPGAVVCHPHPLRGGTMHNTNVYRTAKALAAAGLDVIRFNFRGVGASAGVHDEGRGEPDDVRAALDALAGRGCAPLAGVGYSFGGAQVLKASIDDARVAVVATMGLPVKMYDLAFARKLQKPLLVVQGTGDVFGTPDDVREFFAGMTNVEVFTVEDAGHFFEGKSSVVADAIAQFVLQKLAAQNAGATAADL